MVALIAKNYLCDPPFAPEQIEIMICHYDHKQNISVTH